MQHGWILEPAFHRDIEELVVGNTTPEKEGQTRGQIEIADVVPRPGRHIGRIPLDAEQEVSAYEHALDREADTLFKSAFLAPLLERLEELLRFSVGDWSSVRSARQP